MVRVMLLTEDWASVPTVWIPPIVKPSLPVFGYNCRSKVILGDVI